MKRGDVYYVSYDDSVGCEIKMGRPAVIVSEGRLGERLVVAYMTTSPSTFESKYCKRVASTNRPSYVLCDQLRTIDVVRLGDKMCTLTDEEMWRVECGLRAVFGFGESPGVEELKSELEAAKVELEVQKRAYERVLDMLVDRKISEDLAVREEVVEEPKVVDVNTASFDEIKSLGFSDNVVLNILHGRPFRDVVDLKNVPGVTVMAWNLIKDRVRVSESTPKTTDAVTKKNETVNINTATGVKISEVTGMSSKISNLIVRYRKENGKIESLEELREAGILGDVAWRRHADKLVV